MSRNTAEDIKVIEMRVEVEEEQQHDDPSTNSQISIDITDEAESCCNTAGPSEGSIKTTEKSISPKRKQRCNDGLDQANSYAANKNVAEGLMDIALLSANANQLRFLITYNHEASTYYYSLVLVGLSLVMQMVVGITLIFKRRLKRYNGRRYTRTNEFLLAAVFMVTVVNVLLAAFTTTGTNDEQH